MLLGLAIASCDEPTGPSVAKPIRSNPRPPTKLSFGRMQRLPPDTAFLPAEPGTVDTISIFPFAEGVLVDIEIKGRITMQSHSLAAPIKYSDELDYKGINVPFGSGCLLQATVSFSQQLAGSLPNTADCPIPRTMSDYIIRAKVGGIGTISRTAKPSGNAYPCDSIRASGDDCYTVDGQQTVIITPVAGALDFKGTYNGKRSHGLFVPPFVDSSTVTVNPYVGIVFTDSTISRGLPLFNNSHRWDFADPFDPGHPYWHKTENTCASDHSPYCFLYIKETGTMLSDSRVNGTYQTDAVSIYCLDTLPILNNDLVRQGAMAVNDSSGYPSKPESDRIERAFLIVQDSITPGAEPYIWFFPKANQADICTVGDPFINFAPRPANTRVLGGGHAHAVDAGEYIVCKDSTGQIRTDSAGNMLAGRVEVGGSTQDWTWLKLVNTPGLNPGTVLPMKEYIVKGNEILVLDPSKSRGSELLSSNQYHWKKSGRCAWPKRSTYEPE